jgi:hypothetical protein
MWMLSTELGSLPWCFRRGMEAAARTLSLQGNLGFDHDALVTVAR